MISGWKGKGRASADEIERWKRDEEDDTEGAPSSGVVLELEYVGNGVYDQTYTLPIQLGSNKQTFSLQVDTGSSDIWVASTLCSKCPGRQYDPNASGQSTNVPFNITYLAGYVEGTIYWDTFTIGSYSIENQALAAAVTVNNEPLQNDFNGVLGLALPQNSIISSLIAPSLSSSQDGAQFVTNLFSMTPQSSVPAARFISLTLSRPGSNTIPSLMGVGKHPSKSAVPAIGDGRQVQYSTPLASTNDRGISVGTLFWRSSIKDITVWVNNQPRPVQLVTSRLGGSGGGGSFPTAVLDSGVPLIVSTRAIADAIYGAIGVSPASDGMYYVDCKTPLNLTITLDGRSPIPLHPLDLTTEPGRGATSPNCIGVIQASDIDLQKTNAADMILGVPFVRNVYMVMAYQEPNANGTFPDLRPSDDSLPPSIYSEYRPRLGLQALTDPSVALYEFNRVRVDGLPLNGGSGTNGSGSTEDGKKHLSVGLGVLFGLIGFIGLCFGLFGLRWCLLRRKYGAGTSMGQQNSARDFGAASDAGATALGSGVAASGLLGWWKRKKAPSRSSKEKDLGDYELAMRKDDELPHEDVLRQRKFEEYIRGRDRMTSDYSMSSARTRVGEGDEEDGDWPRKQTSLEGPVHDDALDTASVHDSAGHESRPNDPYREWDPTTELWGIRRVTPAAVPTHRPSRSSLTAYEPSGHDSGDETRGSPERTPMISRMYATDPTGLSSPPPVRAIHRHSRAPSGAPLLPPLEIDESTILPSPALASPPLPREADMAEFGMAGIGTAARSSRVDPQWRYSTAGSDRSGSSSSGGRRKSLTTPVDNTPLRSSPDSAASPLSAVDEFALRNRPISVASTASSRGRTTRPPMGPRQSTTSSIR